MPDTDRDEIAPSGVERLLTLPFVLVVASGLAYFVALAMLNPVLPVYVERELGGGGVAVGVGVGAFAVGAIVLRPFAGRIGDRIGRRILLVGGAAVVAGATALYGVVASLPWLVVMRVIAGVGEAAFFVGAATMITDLAPEARRGEAVSYWSIAVYGGLAVGPYLGELVLGTPGHEHWTTAWLLSAGLAAVAVLVGLCTREAADRPPPPSGPQPLLHRSAIAPGFVLLLGLVSLAGWSGFVKLYAEKNLGLDDVGGVFLLYGALILAIRVLGARLPDRLGARRAGSGALALGTLGMAVIAAWPTVAGLYLGTFVFAVGMSLLYPAMLVLALDGVDPSERGSVVGTFSSFFDLSQGLGALICGAAVSLVGYRGMFVTVAVLAAAGLVYLRAAVTR